MLAVRAEPAERVAWQLEGQDSRAHRAGHCWTKHCLRGSAVPLLPVLIRAWTEVFGKHPPWYRTAVHHVEKKKKCTMQGSKEAESFSLLQRAVNDRGGTKTLSRFSSSLWWTATWEKHLPLSTRPQRWKGWEVIEGQTSAATTPQLKPVNNFFFFLPKEKQTESQMEWIWSNR